MNFLNPFALFGLIAAGAPLLIHLLSRRKARDVAFPSIRYLKEMRSDRIRMLRMKQLAMLILRTLVIVLIVCAFARPAFKSAFRGDGRTAAVIIIDGSASMEYVEGGETLFGHAVRRGVEIPGLLRNDDSAAVIVSGSMPEVLEPGMGRNSERIGESLKNCENPGSAGSPTGAFSLAFDLLASSHAVNREVYYITDGALNTLPDSIPSADVRLYTVLVGPKQRDGAVILDISPADRVAVPGRRLSFSVKGYEGGGTGPSSVELFVNGERTGKEKVMGRSDGSFETVFGFVPDAQGWYSVRATTGDGFFEPGETRWLAIHVADPPEILVVGGSAPDMRFIGSVLDVDDERPVFSLKTVLQDDLDAEDIAACDAIIMSGVTDIPRDLYLEIVGAVMDEGKGIMVFPPKDVKTPLYRDGIFKTIVPLNVVGRIGTTSENGSHGVRMERFDFSHPVFRDISRAGEFRKPEVKSYLKVDPAPQVSVIARFGEGSMAVGQTGCGSGKAMVCTFGIDDGDIAQTGIFVPFMIGAAQYLSGVIIYGGLYETGDGVYENIDSPPSGSQVSLKGENGPAEMVDVRIVRGNAVTKDVSAGMPGFYSIAVNAEEVARFSVNAPRDEVVYRRFEAKTAADTFKGVRWSMITDVDSLSEHVARDRYGKELFGLFIIAALLLLAVEMIVARKV